MKLNISSLLLLSCLTAITSCNSPGKNADFGTGNDTSGQVSGDNTEQQATGQTAPDPLFLKLMGNNENLELVAGRSAGILQLKAPSDTLHTLLGTADSTAVDMCKDLSAWQAGADATKAGVADVDAAGIRVYSLCDNDLDMRKSIQIVGLRGAPFSTTEGASPESTFSELKQLYPGLQVLGSVQSSGDMPTLFIADDIETGIAFELSDTTARGRCLGVLVHLPGKAVTTTNIPLYPGLKKLAE